jgi:hypothetical protein
MRETRTGLLVVRAGCFQCHGYEMPWETRNSMGIAARHHDATGHTTHVEQTVSVQYGPMVSNLDKYQDEYDAKQPHKNRTY